MIIARGTTPTVVCNIPNDVSLDDINEIWFNISQNGCVLVDRTLRKGQVEINKTNHTILTILTQRETLRLNNTEPRPFFSLRILYSDGNAIANMRNKKAIIFVQEIAKEGVIA